MSTKTLVPGGLLTLDPADKVVVGFDFDTLDLPVGVTLDSYVFTITALKQNGVTALTYDNDTLYDSDRRVQLRLLATTATLGDRYRVACKGITSETPEQDETWSITVQIERH